MKLGSTLAALGACAAVLGLAACGDDTKSSGYAAFTDAKTTPTPSETTAPDASVTTPAGKKPDVRVPKGAPPSKLKIKDLKTGSGPAAKAGDSVTVHYVGVFYATGKQLDASWDTGEPLTFTLGQGEVIKGWDQGIPGMKVGGRRQLIVPPDLAYGEAGDPPDIKPNTTLVFVIDLLGVQ